MIITWELIWRIRLRGLIPGYVDEREYESEQLKSLVKELSELNKRMEEIDKVLHTNAVVKMEKM